MSKVNPDEEVTPLEASKRLGMTKQSMNEWLNRPGAPTVMRNGKRLVRWPDFPIWYRDELTRFREKPGNFDEAKERKMSAEAELAELELAKERGEMVAITDVEAEVGQVFDRVRARLMAAPGRGAPLTVGLKTVKDSQVVWEGVMGEVLEELSMKKSA